MGSPDKRTFIGRIEKPPQEWGGFNQNQLLIMKSLDSRTPLKRQIWEQVSKKSKNHLCYALYPY